MLLPPLGVSTLKSLVSLAGEPVSLSLSPCPAEVLPSRSGWRLAGLRSSMQLHLLNATTHYSAEGQKKVFFSSCMGMSVSACSQTHRAIRVQSPRPQVFNFDELLIAWPFSNGYRRKIGGQQVE